MGDRSSLQPGKDAVTGFVRARASAAGFAEAWRVRSACVGFYWTLPISGADFYELPADIDEAARVSRTIRYQRERVRQWAQENAYRVVGEVAFIDVRTDRATELVKGEIREAQRLCDEREAMLAYVWFDEHSLWRRNSHLRSYVRELGLTPMEVFSDPITIDGRRFDPIAHFRASRRREEQNMVMLRKLAYEGLANALSAVPEGAGRWETIAKRLNDDGVRTLKGSAWTAENVRKVVGRHQKAFDQSSV